jgi:hypothetical protein
MPIKAPPRVRMAPRAWASTDIASTAPSMGNATRIPSRAGRVSRPRPASRAAASAWVPIGYPISTPHGFGPASVTSHAVQLR